MIGTFCQFTNKKTKQKDILKILCLRKVDTYPNPEW